MDADKADIAATTVDQPQRQHAGAKAGGRGASGATNGSARQAAFTRGTAQGSTAAELPNALPSTRGQFNQVATAGSESRRYPLTQLESVVNHRVAQLEAIGRGQPLSSLSTSQNRYRTSKVNCSYDQRLLERIVAKQEARKATWRRHDLVAASRDVAFGRRNVLLSPLSAGGKGEQLEMAEPVRNVFSPNLTKNAKNTLLSLDLPNVKQGLEALGAGGSQVQTRGSALESKSKGEDSQQEWRSTAAKMQEDNGDLVETGADAKHATEVTDLDHFWLILRPESRERMQLPQGKALKSSIGSSDEEVDYRTLTDSAIVNNLMAVTKRPYERSVVPGVYRSKKIKDFTKAEHGIEEAVKNAQLTLEEDRDQLKMKCFRKVHD